VVNPSEITMAEVIAHRGAWLAAAATTRPRRTVQIVSGSELPTGERPKK